MDPTTSIKLLTEVNTIVTPRGGKYGSIRNFDITNSKTNCSLLTSRIQNVSRYQYGAS